MPKYDKCILYVKKTKRSAIIPTRALLALTEKAFGSTKPLTNSKVFFTVCV